MFSLAKFIVKIHHTLCWKPWGDRGRDRDSDTMDFVAKAIGNAKERCCMH